MRQLENMAHKKNEPDAGFCFKTIAAILKWTLGMQSEVPGAGDFDTLLAKLDAEASRWPPAAPAQGEKR
jgi:hypothetical protein